MCFAESGPGGELHRLRHLHAHGRSLRRARRHRRRAATLRRRADAAPRPRPHGPLRLRPADPGGDDQHQRHPPGPATRPCSTQLAPMRDRLEIYLQFDGLDDAHPRRASAARSCCETKLAALDALREHDIRCTLVCTVDHNTNLHEVGAVVKFGLDRPDVPRRQLPARHLLRPAPRPRRPGTPRHHAGRRQGPRRADGGMLAEGDFYPLPCATRTAT